MEKRVFHYRSGLFYFLLVFQIIWATTWLVLAFVAPQAFQFPWQRIWNPASGIAGIPLLLFIGQRLRIEVSGGEIRFYDWIGRLRAQGSLAGNEVVPMPFPGPINVSQVRTPDGGSFMFTYFLENVQEFRTLLKTGSIAAPPPFVQAPAVVSSVKTYDSRWTPLHFVSAFWIFLILNAAVSPFLSQWRPNGRIAPDSFIILGLLLLVSLHFHLATWNQKVRLGPDGIEWTNGLGQVVKRARLDEIKSVEGPSVWRQSIRIETTEGTIRPLVMLRNSKELADDIRKIVAYYR